MTGAPFEFVHVIFPELPDGRTFTGGTPSAPIFIRGSIRAGRSDGNAGQDRSVPAMLRSTPPKVRAAVRHGDDNEAGIDGAERA